VNLHHKNQKINKTRILEKDYCAIAPSLFEKSLTATNRSSIQTQKENNSKKP